MIPPQPMNSVRITLDQSHKGGRLDVALMEAIRKHPSLDIKNITRSQFKELFKDKRIVIKGQPARPSSTLSSGTTYVDLLGFGS